MSMLHLCTMGQSACFSVARRSLYEDVGRAQVPLSAAFKTEQLLKHCGQHALCSHAMTFLSVVSSTVCVGRLAAASLT